MTNSQTLHTVKVDCNTFNFSIGIIPARGKRQAQKVVTVEHITDWTGTDWENDPIMNQPSFIKVTLWGGLTDTEAINRTGSKILKDWQPVTL